MKPQFHEDHLSPKLDPVDGRTADFDWASMDQELGELAEELDAHDYEALTVALRRVLLWIVHRCNNPGSDLIIGRRALALTWVINPGLIPGSPSLRRLERRLGIPQNMLSRYAADATREFGYRNRGQAHGWNRGQGQSHSRPQPPKETAGQAGKGMGATTSPPRPRTRPQSLPATPGLDAKA